MQENLRKRSHSYSADSLDGEASQVEALQKENEEMQQEIHQLQQKLLQYGSVDNHAEDDFIDLKRKYEALEMENNRLRARMEDSVDRVTDEAVFSEAGLQSRRVL